MTTKINKTTFGSITIGGKKYTHDVLIRLDGSIHKRKKKLSKELYGTSHLISLAEAEHIYEKGAETLIIGTGQFDNVRLSDDAWNYLNQKGIDMVLANTPKAIKLWNESKGKTIALFHVTC